MDNKEYDRDTEPLKDGVKRVLDKLQELGLMKAETAEFVTEMVDAPLNSVDFLTLPASKGNVEKGEPGKHHFYNGGLQVHTREVMDFAVSQLLGLPTWKQVEDVNWVALVVGAVWHDFGKTVEYRYAEHVTAEDVSGELGSHQFKAGDIFVPEWADCHHITYSLAEFQRLCAGKVSAATMSKVLHVVEAHHGRREWSSPKTPHTLEALAVHQADMLSVMQDCNINPANRGH